MCHWTSQDTYYIRHTNKMRVIAALPNAQKQTHEAAKMRRQRNKAQTKEQIKTPEKELNKMEISNLI